MLRRNHESYFSNTRYDLIELVADGNNKILEIGCGEGNTGKSLKDHGKAVEVVGVEKVSEIADIIKTKIDRVICADVETVEFPFSEGYFDYVILGDVLEHLCDPWTFVSKIKRYLKKSGYVIASIPNVQHWSVIKNLLFLGRWKYEDAGLLDKAHLRFFTRKEIMELLSSTGFEIQEIHYNQSRSRFRLLNILMALFCKDLLVYQFLIKAKKIT